MHMLASMIERKEHWEKVYAGKETTEVSWYRPRLDASLALIDQSGIGTDAEIIDVGAGASTMADDLLARGSTRLTVLDISGAALDRTRLRLGERADLVTWIEADVTDASLPAGRYDLWHDRAVFHFLTDPADRALYIGTAAAALKSGGDLIIATFGAEGPLRCSGLDVVRYSPEMLLAEFGDRFTPVRTLHDIHTTPAGGTQQFLYCHLRRR